MVTSVTSRDPHPRPVFDGWLGDGGPMCSHARRVASARSGMPDRAFSEGHHEIARADLQRRSNLSIRTFTSTESSNNWVLTIDGLLSFLNKAGVTS